MCGGASWWWGNFGESRSGWEGDADLGIWGKFLGGKAERLGGFPSFVRCQTKINRKSVELGWTTRGPEVALVSMLPVMLGYAYKAGPYAYI